MKKWEYKTIRFEGTVEADDDDEDDPDGILSFPSWEQEQNQQRQKGWELAS